MLWSPKDEFPQLRTDTQSSIRAVWALPFQQPVFQRFVRNASIVRETLPDTARMLALSASVVYGIGFVEAWHILSPEWFE